MRPFLGLDAAVEAIGPNRQPGEELLGPVGLVAASGELSEPLAREGELSILLGRQRSGRCARRVRVFRDESWGSPIRADAHPEDPWVFGWLSHKTWCAGQPRGRCWQTNAIDVDEG